MIIDHHYDDLAEHKKVYDPLLSYELIKSLQKMNHVPEMCTGSFISLFQILPEQLLDHMRQLESSNVISKKPDLWIVEIKYLLFIKDALIVAIKFAQDSVFSENTCKSVQSLEDEKQT